MTPEITGGFDSEILPGEEELHTRLQVGLMRVLTDRHKELGMAFKVRGRIKNKGGDATVGVLRSIEAARIDDVSRCSCEFFELEKSDGPLLENRFFTLVPPEDEPARASVILLAKVRTLLEGGRLQLLTDEEFQTVAGLDH